MNSSEILIKRILSICKERGISVNKLSSLTGITQSTLNNIVSGTNKSPRLETLIRIAVGLGMTVAQFLDFPEMNEIQVETEQPDEDGE